MPEMRYYTVTEEREVKVTADSAIGAAIIANVAFKNMESVLGVPVSIDEKAVGHTLSHVRVRDINAREDY